MGTDIYVGSGILFSIDDAVDLFFKGFNKKKISLLVSELKSIIENKEEHDFINDIEDIYELKSWFVSFCQKQVNNEYVSEQSLLINIWNVIVEKTKFKNLPEISFEYFTSSRYSGYEVPIETVCVVFNDTDLFETKMSKKGEAVAKAMGLKKIEKTTWTVYSY
jgi:hypothetical protein